METLKHFPTKTPGAILSRSCLTSVGISVPIRPPWLTTSIWYGLFLVCWQDKYRRRLVFHQYTLRAIKSSFGSTDGSSDINELRVIPDRYCDPCKEPRYYQIWFQLNWRYVKASGALPFPLEHLFAGDQHLDGAPELLWQSVIKINHNPEVHLRDLTFAARLRSLVNATSKGTVFRESATRFACSTPSSFSSVSICPWSIWSRLAWVSPWRTIQIVARMLRKKP